MRNRPKYNEYPKPLNPERPDLVIPLDDLTLEIYKTSDGCDIQIKNAFGIARHAGSIMHRRTIFTRTGDIINAVYFGRAIETTDGQTTHIVDELLTPKDPNDANVIQRPDGSLYCTTCGQTIENTANFEMRKEGAISYCHICPGPPHRFKKIKLKEDSENA